MTSNQLQHHQPPPTPTYILRGHASPIHALHLFSQNLRLISADANGWIVVWDLVTKRPVTVWKAHEGAVLEVKGFVGSGTGTVVYTHGRDHKLRVWRFRVQDEEILDKILPVDMDEASQVKGQSQSQPWLLHSLPVNALNFCAFSMLFIRKSANIEDGQESQQQQPEPDAAAENKPESPVLIAVPNALDSGAIDIFHLPLERRICTIPADTTTKTGMVMAVKLFISATGELYAASAYEDGHVIVFVRRGAFKEADLSSGASWKWEKVYASRLHSQPVLSIDVSPSMDYVLSSSADALLIKHPISRPGPLGTGY
ncbi:ASTRA complex subunit [Aspergillus wentii]|nr:ASTRA complex subunit [Aspergillus wentii]